MSESLTLAKIKDYWLKMRLTEEENARVERALTKVNSAGFDPWGLDPVLLKTCLALFKNLYRDYFRVETLGIEKVPAGRVLLAANHGGQIPIDGFLIGLSMLLDAEPPRIVRGMVERWAPTLPWVSTLFQRLGQMVGDQRNCHELLEKDECVLAFPEGATGSGKTIFERYELQKFGTGFVRLAIESKTPIVPVAVIGCEETYLSFSRLEPVAKFLGMPYLPLTPQLLPLPTKVTIRYADPIYFEGDADAPDAEIDAKVDQVRQVIRRELEIGLRKRGEAIFTGSAK